MCTDNIHKNIRQFFCMYFHKTLYKLVKVGESWWKQKYPLEATISAKHKKKDGLYPKANYIFFSRESSQCFLPRKLTYFFRGFHNKKNTLFISWFKPQATKNINIDTLKKRKSSQAKPLNWKKEKAAKKVHKDEKAFSFFCFIEISLTYFFSLQLSW